LRGVDRARRPRPRLDRGDLREAARDRYVAREDHVEHLRVEGEDAAGQRRHGGAFVRARGCSASLVSCHACSRVRASGAASALPASDTNA
jgi:hypothetical protein